MERNAVVEATTRDLVQAVRDMDGAALEEYAGVVENNADAGLDLIEDGATEQARKVEDLFSRLLAELLDERR